MAIDVVDAPDDIKAVLCDSFGFANTVRPCHDERGGSTRRSRAKRHWRTSGPDPRTQPMRAAPADQGLLNNNNLMGRFYAGDYSYNISRSQYGRKDRIVSEDTYRPSDYLKIAQSTFGIRARLGLGHVWD